MKIFAKLSQWWNSKPEKERERLKSFIPLVLYTFGFVYFVLYLSILNTVNRDHVGGTVKNWFGGDKPQWMIEKMQEEKEIQESFQFTRKRVTGGR